MSTPTHLVQIIILFIRWSFDMNGREGPTLADGPLGGISGSAASGAG
jgi:hypothetical protein